VGIVHLLAAEGGPHNLWNPTIIGVLTVLCAVGLFCGSTYLLLGTNLGARLGFLVAAAGLTAFLVLLTTLWWTSGNSGIDPPHGDSPAWKAVELTRGPEASKIDSVRSIIADGEPLTTDQLTNLKPAIDAAIVPAVAVAGQEPKPQPLATLGISSTTDYLIDFPGFKSYQIGGGTKNLFWHTPRYAAVQVCLARKDSAGNAVTPPECDPLKAKQHVILSYDFGSLRQPVVAYWFVSVILFGLSLLGLHWWEKDERERKRAALKPVPSSGN
jgi:hypothetical protein